MPLGRLVLLTGINGKGKSTALQALLLIHQSVNRAHALQQTLRRIELNGHYVRLGNFREVQHRDRRVGVEPITISFEFADDATNATVTSLVLEQRDGNERWAGIARIEVERFDGNKCVFQDSREPDDTDDYVILPFDGASADKLGRFSRLGDLTHVHYVSADRLGPRDFFPRTSDNDFVSVGVRGEMTAEVLYRMHKDRVTLADNDVRTREGASTMTILDQTSAWLSYVFDGGAVQVTSLQETVLTLEMNADNSVHYYRAINLGFGYSYALPILVAGLMAMPGEFLIIENPEAHLHPLAQSRIGEFLATVSAVGVQVLVESHSEHVLNAFRLAVRGRQLTPQDIRVLYFRRDEDEPIIHIPVQEDGGIASWPDGFFDQRMRDFEKLFGEGQDG